MEAEIKAGAKLDMLTKSELQEVMDGLDFNVKIGRGLKFRRIEYTAQFLNGAFISEGVGPLSGFTWNIMRASLFFYDAATPTVPFYTDHRLNNVSTMIASIFTTECNQYGPTVIDFPKSAVILHSGDVVIPVVSTFNTPVTPNNTYAQVAYDVIEVPTFSEGLLNL